MADPPGQHGKAFDELAISEQVRRALAPSQCMQDALSAVSGGTSMRVIQDVLAKNDLRDQLAAIHSATEMMRDVRLTDDLTRRMLGLQDLSLKSALGQLASAPAWLDKVLALTNPPWTKAASNLAGMSYMQRVVDDANRQLAPVSRMFEQQSSSLRAINDILKPALVVHQPITAMFGRLGLDSAAQLRNLHDPAGFREMRETLARIQSEQSAFIAALPKLASPWAGIDWARMQRLVDRTAELADGAEESTEAMSAWDIESISPEEQAEFAEAMQPIVEAVEEAAISLANRDTNHAEAIAAILDYCERLEMKLDEQSDQLQGIDATLATEKRSRRIGWIVALMMFLAQTGWDLSKEWAASHTTPAIDRALGLLDEPVSSAKQQSAIRRDAGEAVSAIDVSPQDMRYLRVVVRRSLPVYGCADAKDPSIDRLRSGQLVAIVTWFKKWRNVQWRDSTTSEIRSGWVRAKYIAKIKR